MLRAADPSIRFVIARLVGPDTDDVLQSAYLKAFRAWAAFRHDAAPATWLHRIAYTTAIDHLRRQRRLGSTAVKPVEADSIASGDDVAGQASARLDLAAALDALSPDHRAVLLLADGQGRSHPEVAEILGVPAGTVASRLHRARLAVRARLSIGSET